MSEENSIEPEVKPGTEVNSTEPSPEVSSSPLIAPPKKPAHLPQAKLPWLNSQKQNNLRQQNMNTKSNNSLKQRRQTPRSGNR